MKDESRKLKDNKRAGDVTEWTIEMWNPQLFIHEEHSFNGTFSQAIAEIKDLWALNKNVMSSDESIGLWVKDHAQDWINGWLRIGFQFPALADADKSKSWKIEIVK